MVERVVWFSPIHYEIMGFFDEHDIIISPHDLAINIGYDRNYTGKECRMLSQAGLLKSQDGVYQLTDKGRSFVNGDIPPDEIEKPDS